MRRVLAGMALVAATSACASAHAAALTPADTSASRPTVPPFAASASTSARAGPGASSGPALSPGTPEAPLERLPYAPALDPAAMDRQVDPCEDFYRYACGGWMASHPIPADQSSWDVYRKMEADNQQLLWGLLVRLSAPAAGRGPDDRRIGDAFAACMDERAVEAAGTRALAPLLGRIAGMTSKKDLPAVMAQVKLETYTIGGDSPVPGPLFGFVAQPDYADARQVIASANAGGLGLPDRDYYLKTDAVSKGQRSQYVAHVGRMFELLGDAPAAARHEAEVVLALETALARATLTQVQARDPHRLDHAYTPRSLQGLTPGFDWQAFLVPLGLADLARINVSEPAFYRALQAQLNARPLSDFQAYLRWQVAHVLAPYLSHAFVDEDFAFYHRNLAGVPQQRPRWKRCVALVDAQLGEALGREFVRVAFNADLKDRTLHMTRQIEAAMAAEIERLDWMSSQTKAKALEKLHGIVNNIGYPDHWRDYSALEIRRDDLAGNVRRGNAFEMQRQLAKIGKPVDRGDWQMSPQTVNAYYEPQLNTINFPAGILEPPLFDARLDAAPNYGNTGGTIGHELTHGFDDEGRQFDAGGNLRNWWTKKDAAEFQRRTQCLVDQYAKYVVVDDLHINSRLTLGEDLADFGGLLLALVAWKDELREHPAPAGLIDGLTPEQRFFVGDAQWACSNDRPEQLRLNVLTDPHSPKKYRINGLMANFPEFQQAFHCRTGQPMAPATRCRVW